MTSPVALQDLTDQIISARAADALYAMARRGAYQLISSSLRFSVYLTQNGYEIGEAIVIRAATEANPLTVIGIVEEIIDTTPDTVEVSILLGHWIGWEVRNGV